MYLAVFTFIGLTLMTLTGLVLSVDPTVRITETFPDTKAGDIIQAERGKAVTITCFVENLPLGTLVRWQRTYISSEGRETTEPIATGTGVEDNNRFSIEQPTSTLQTYRLRIKSIAVENEGVYMCFVMSIRHTKVFEERKVYVYIAPTLIPQQTSSDMSANEGDIVTLKCNATGRPTPNIMWSRTGRALLPIGQETHDKPEMVITSGIRAEHRGMYICRASNIIGSVERRIEVDVKFKPIVTPNRKVVRQAPGYVTELQCLIEANPGVTELSWFKGAQTISRTSNRYTVQSLEGAFNRLTYELKYTSGVEEKDYGTYRCQARNNMGTVSASVELRKADQPQNSVKLGMVIAGCSNHKPGLYASVLIPALAVVMWRLRL